MRVWFARAPVVSPTANPVGGHQGGSPSMYVPATSAQPAAPATPLAPIEITTGGAPPLAAGLAGLGATPAHVSLVVRRPALNVLADHASTITDRKSTRLNSSHANISYAGFCLKK